MGIPSTSLPSQYRHLADRLSKPRAKRGTGEAARRKASRIARLPYVLALLGVEKLPDGLTVVATSGKQNGWERGFLATLAPPVMFKPFSLRLAKRCVYTPDIVQRVGDTVWIYETKGHMREAARVRLLVAASQYPQYRFVLAKKVNGQWVKTEVER